MGRFRSGSSRNVNAGQMNPARFVLTWKTTDQGYWSAYDRQEKKRFVVRELEGIILEPSIHTINQVHHEGEWKVYSNYADQASHKELKIWKKHLRGDKSRELLAQGPWGTVKSGVGNQGRYFCVWWVWVEKMSLSLDVTKKATEKKIGELIELQFPYTVGALIKEVSDKAGVDFNELDGYRFSFRDTILKKDKKNRDLFYPSILLTETDPTEKDIQDLIPVFNELDQFLEDHWASRSPASDEYEEEEDPRSGILNEPVTTTEIKVEEPEDDDLPF